MRETRIGHWTKLGAVIRDARRSQSLTQAELARRAGVSRSWLAKLESGHRGAEFEQILLVVSALGLGLSLVDDRDDDTEFPATASGHAFPAEAATRLLDRHRAAQERRRAAWGTPVSKSDEVSRG